ncbi:hypothetical protein, partial [Pedobacter segetis]|uniref:hypothetical protein n=1 Tax=Pedobacter segetis TaxID=2793069 RepID=UPI001F233C1D
MKKRFTQSLLIPLCTALLTILFNSCKKDIDVSSKNTLEKAPIVIISKSGATINDVGLQQFKEE